MTPRGAGTTASAAPRIDQDAMPPDSGGAGPGLGPERAIPRCARSFRITAGSCSVAISRSRPPQCGHARTSIANARCMRAAQLQARQPLFTFVPSEPAACGVKVVGSGATRPYATTRSRQRARAANTPWQISRFVSGRGGIAARRSNNSSGSNTSSRVPSCHAVFSSSATRPSLRSRRRSCAKGGRKT
jgi:hypothetical protein